MTVVPKRWWWVRHAPVAGADGRLYGQLDVACETGDGDAFRALAAGLPREAAWFVSPLRRTQQTLAAIGELRASPVPTARVEPAFAEQHFGRWQGRSWPEMQAADPALYEAFWRNPTRTAPPGGESFLAQMRRTERAITRLSATTAETDLVCIAHAGTIRSAVALALNLTPETALALVIDNLSITRLEFVADGLLHSHGGSWRVRTVNQPGRGLADWSSARPAC